MLVLLFLTIAMPNTTTPLQLLPNTQIFTCIPTLDSHLNIHLCNQNGGGHQGTQDYTMTMWKQCSRDGQPFGCAVLFPLLRITLPSFLSLSSPSHHCPLLPITVPSSPSLSPPPHHCPLLPITVPSSPSLYPPPHHCPLLPITVPSSPSHHVIMADCFFPLLSRYSLLPPI